jgi:hypothetical protein
MAVQFDRACIGRAGWLALAGLAMATALPAPASAQGFFDFFSGFQRPNPFQTLPPRTQAYADPNLPSGMPEAPINSGRSVAYCVRLCDGRYFPIHHHVAATPVQLCNALCPASKTKVFSGSAIDQAIAPDGSHYAGLENSYKFREKLVPNCTCNGRDAFGLAPMDPSADPTLRPGDVVATQTGLVAFNGTKTNKRGVQTADFTPIAKSALSPEVRRKLSAVSIARAR